MRLSFAIVAIALYLIIGAYAFTGYAFSADEYTYMNTARAFARGEAPAREAARMPLYPFLLSLPYRLSDELAFVEATAKLLSLLFGLLALLLTWLLAKNLGLRERGLSALALGTSPFFAFIATRVLTETLFITLFLVCAMCLQKALRRPSYLLAFGAAAGALFLTRYIGLYVWLLPPLYFWRLRRSRLLLSHWFFGSIACALIVLLPWFWYSAALTGDPLSLGVEFIKGQIFIERGAMALPDRIPSYALATPFILGALAPVFVAFIFLERKRLVIKERLLPALTLFIVVVVMEIHGLTAFPLLRYLLPIAPFAAILVSSFVAEGLRWRTAALGLIAINFALSIYLINWFSSYEKHVDYRGAGLWVRENCESIASNIPFVSEHYLGKEVSGERARCVMLSGWDVAEVKAPEGVALAKKFGKVFIYRSE